MSVLTADELEQRVDIFPRESLAFTPTPFHKLPRFSEALGGPDVWMKRDDQTGLAFGGNKTRVIEFLFADILMKRADIVITGAYTQSNWCRQISAAGAKLGIDVVVFLLHGEKGPEVQGNLLLMKLLGAEVNVIDIESVEDIDRFLISRANELEARGRTPYIVKPLELEMQSLAALSYVLVAAEMDRQFDAAGIEPDHIYVAGANVTPAGTILGLRALGRRVTFHNIAPIRWGESRAVNIADIANAAAERLDLDLRISADDVNSTDTYIGPRYGVVTEAGREAVKLLARTEGILLDPVYTAKAMSALIDDVRSGRLGADETVVFMHTGGTPALFSYAQDLDVGQPNIIK